MKNLILISTILISSLSARSQLFELRTDMPFSEVADDSRSANWVDPYNLGKPGIFFSNGPSSGQDNTFYFYNEGTGEYVASATSPFTSDGAPSDGATFADVLNDGYLGCFVANWYGEDNLLYLYSEEWNWLEPVTDGPVTNTPSYSETGAWGDANLDGFVDLYVTNSADDNTKNFFYLNEGDGTFTEVETGAFVTSQGKSRSVTWADFNNDGVEDILVTNEDNEQNILYRNDNFLNFTPVDAGDLTNDTGNSMSGTWGDYDNDGDLDVFVSNYGQNNMLYRNNGDETFTAMEESVVSQDGGLSFGANWGDFDNDADLDLFVGNAFSDGDELADFLYLNNGDGSFTKVTDDETVTNLGWTFGNAFGDMDLDGDLDLIKAKCFDGGEPNELYENKSSQQDDPNSWIVVNCIGTASNRSAIGARVEITAIIDGEQVSQIREVTSQSSYCGQNMLPLHFGLKDADAIESLIVQWPIGLEEAYGNLEVNQYYNLVEATGISTDIPEIREDISEGVNVYPNPVDDKFTLSTNLSDNTYVTLTLRNISGQVVQDFGTRKFRSGDHSIELNLKDEIAPGIYFLNGVSSNTAFTRKLVLK
ncbi:FG-GAP-like repeat-containing protein [Halocola ammonii]